MHSKKYQEIQIEFIKLTNTHNQNRLVELLTMHPYHISLLLQSSDIMKMSGDHEMALDFIQRTLYSFEKSIDSKDLLSGDLKLDFNYSENRK